MSMETKKTAIVEINFGNYKATIEGGILEEWDSEWRIAFEGNEKIYGSFNFYKSYTREGYFCTIDDLKDALWEEIDEWNRKYADTTVTETEVEVEVEDEEV